MCPDQVLPGALVPPAVAERGRIADAAAGQREPTSPLVTWLHGRPLPEIAEHARVARRRQGSFAGVVREASRCARPRRATPGPAAAPAESSSGR